MPTFPTEILSDVYDPVAHALKTTGSSGGSGTAVTVANGSDVAEGATTDAAVTPGAAGTISGKLRQISDDQAATRSGVEALAAFGQDVMANSFSVAIASNQSTVPVTPTAPSTIGHGVRTVTTAGTDVQLSATTVPCKKVLIQAQTDNTGWIAVGAIGVDATEATGTGSLLAAGDADELEIDNLNKIYIDATVSGEGVRYRYVV